jgi:hypothetical protein
VAMLCLLPSFVETFLNLKHIVKISPKTKLVSKNDKIRIYYDADPLSLLRVARPPSQDLLVREPKWLFWFQTGTLRKRHTHRSLTNARLAFPSAKRELPWHTTKSRDLALSQKGCLSGTETSQVKHPIPSFFEPLGGRNAEMSQHLVPLGFRIS